MTRWPSRRPSSVKPISAPYVNSRVRPRSWTIAALKLTGQRVCLAKRAGGHNACAVAKLERQIGRPGPSNQAILPRAGEHTADLLAGSQRANGLRQFDQIGRADGVTLAHMGMMY